jgi:hypothetical protein
MIKHISLWVLAIWAAGIIPMFIFQMAIGPVTPGLCAVRAAVWPLYVTTGIPRGLRLSDGLKDKSESWCISSPA